MITMHQLLNASYILIQSLDSHLNNHEIYINTHITIYFSLSNKETEEMRV